MQWQNMTIHEYKNVKIAKSQNPRSLHPAKIKTHTVLGWALIQYSHDTAMILQKIIKLLAILITNDNNNNHDNFQSIPLSYWKVNTLFVDKEANLYQEVFSNKAATIGTQVPNVT